MEQATPVPRKLQRNIRVFVLIELVFGALFTLPGTAVVLWAVLAEAGTWQVAAIGGLAIAFGIWLHVILLLYRLTTYQVAALVEIAPALKGLMSLLQRLSPT